MTPFANDMWQQLHDMGFLRKFVGIGYDPLCQRYVAAIVRGGFWL